MSHADFEIEVFVGQSGIDRLRDEWLSLTEVADIRSFYCHPAWFEAFIKEVEKTQDRIHFFAVFQSAKLVAVFPIEFEKKGSLITWTQASIPSREQLYMPDFLINKEADKAAVFLFFIRELKRYRNTKWDVFLAKEVLDSSVLIEMFSNSGEPIVFKRSRDSCNFIDLDAYETLSGNFTRKHRQNITRRIKQANALGIVEYCRLVEIGHVLDGFANFLELEERGWKGGHGKGRGKHKKPLAISLSPRKKQFYQRVISKLAESGNVELFALYIDQKLIGMQVCLIFGQFCVGLKTAYDQEFSKCSPGLLVKRFLLEHFADHSDVKVISLISDSPAHRVWNPRVQRYVSLRTPGNTVKGLILFWIFKFKTLLESRKSTGNDQRI
ncbi:MAG: GNAT family N-acetyltransferase [Pseudomonadota bacterium]